MAKNPYSPPWKVARNRKSPKTLEQEASEEIPGWPVFFHAYCTGAIEKHMQDHGLPNSKQKSGIEE